MLSLLSLLLASGTVLRADTDEWTPDAYPDPRTNSTLCNTWANSTLCDPDHMLTDYWRERINDNIRAQMEKLKEANIQYTERAPLSCLDNDTEPVKIYVLLAKRIHTANNQTITEEDLTNFGNELTQRFGFDKQSCKNFLLLIGVEAAKLAYVRTGKDLKLPADLMQRVFHEYNSFNAKNYMEGLNKIVDEIGAQMTDPFKDLEELIREYTVAPAAETAPTAAAPGEEAMIWLNQANATNSAAENGTLLVEGETRTAAPVVVVDFNEMPWLILMLMSTVILLATFVLLILWMKHLRRRRRSLKVDTLDEQQARSGTAARRLMGGAKRSLRRWLRRGGGTDRRRRLAEAQLPALRQLSDASLRADTGSITESIEGVAQRSTTPVKDAHQLKRRDASDYGAAQRTSTSFSV